MFELPVSLMVGLILFGWTLWAVLFWGSIALVDRYNARNTFGMALVWAGVDLALSVAVSFAGIAGIAVMLAWLFILLLRHYELGFLRTLGVVIVTVAGPYFVWSKLVAMFLENERMFLFVIYGFPLVAIAVWRWPRTAAASPEGSVPSARLARGWRREKAAKAPKAVVTAAPQQPAPVAAPIVAPPAPVTPRADGEPSLLR